MHALAIHLRIVTLVTVFVHRFAMIGGYDHNGVVINPGVTQHLEHLSDLEIAVSEVRVVEIRNLLPVGRC